ncbi:UDP-N-acetylmuramoyl-tripeptide--D-alanyl-D-alanine ligase [Salinibacterium sp. SYSU T00001]|uniref:Mur ligase family protein n=1 Tax=Homoserinimonas sedimenticola TaxID=2986805 RepID=UPI002235CD5B|nr:UDP-N-acetylmuramoyl-tripeptide--D-alanyl-D-alanine ligase [Salinibacterium sedimenticola]MCW4384902.1 UDP-N-acetylmuramoyl-tripeptide--D-alanyl-D-alanine ligase [Salinibacterium sedimenticola]
MTPLLIVTLVLGLGAAALAVLRWLRVAQREHYIAGWVGRIAALWVARRIENAITTALALLLVAAAVLLGVAGAELASAITALLALLAAALLPFGLGVRGTSAPLNWTPRARRLALAFSVALLAIGALFWWILGAAGAALTILLAPVLMDAVLVPMNAVEKRLSHKYLVSARKRLGQVRPTVVAITGSYGKTSTKGYVAHVLAGAFSVVASPASFNNLMGLSRAVNDRVVPGTEVFVAEMGVYGPGEIRELSESFPPDVAAITTIGEAHLARMKTKETIARAKGEITERAKTVVLPVDEPELRALIERCRAEGKRVITVSTVPGTEADVVVDAATGVVTMATPAGTSTAPLELSGTGHAVNVAVTVGIALALGMEPAAIGPRLTALPGSQHRAEVQEAPNGTVIIDDTYNSNPVGSERALEGAAALAEERGGTLVVVTPGMVELGSVQFERNRAFAASVTARGGTLLVVGRTNRAALLAGAEGAAHPALVFDRRPDAVQAALDQAGDRGVILYENDLPDHYP